MKYRFYITEWTPDGTHDLVITDSDNQIIECIEEALFGVHSGKRLFTGETTLLFDGEGIFGTAEFERSKLNVSDVFQVFAITLDTLKRHIAVSPVADDTETCRILKPYIDAVETK